MIQFLGTERLLHMKLYLDDIKLYLHDRKLYMSHRLLIPVLAVVGLLVMIYTVAAGEKDYPSTPPLSEPASSPFTHSVAGSGLVEASSQNIAVASHLDGTIAQVSAQIGERVEKGAILFVLDDRQTQATLKTREAARAVAKSRVEEAQALFSRAKFQLEQVSTLKDLKAVSREEVQRRETEASATRALLGAAIASVAYEDAQIDEVKMELERMTVKAPIDGTVLQVNIRPGELVSKNPGSVAPVIIGDISRLHVRVDIDENDAWRLSKGAKARGFLKGNARLETDLSWVDVEPLVIPKHSLTGASTERVDTRVLAVLFSFDPGNLPVYVGQQMDVFIEANS